MLKLLKLTKVSHCRPLSTTRLLPASQAGRFRVSIKQDNPLTYEQAHKPNEIQSRKEWNSFNTSNIPSFGLWPAEVAIQDMFIRKFITGTWHDLFVSEITIKRQANLIRIGGIVQRTIHARKMYWLIGYSEEMLGSWLQCIIKMEIVVVGDKKDVIFKYV